MQLTNKYWYLIAPPSTQDFSGKVGSNLALNLGPGYFLLQEQVCMLETCLLLAWVRVHW